MEQIDLFIRFGAAIAIGFLIGLQREFAHGGQKQEITAGERTFALMGLTGYMAALAADELESSLVFLGVLLIMGLFTAVAYFIAAWRGQTGLTTEVAILVTVLIGALCYWGYLTLAVAIGIAATVLLSIKLETDRFVRALTRQDLFAVLQFAVISAIVLPVLPNQSFFEPPFDVLNPFNIWLMVVFISGIGFMGYVLIKVVDPESGISLTGLLGGLVSSTAVTLSFTERSNRDEGMEKSFALAIIVAWTVMFIRILVEVGALNLELLGIVWVPLVAAGLVGVGYAIYLFLSQRASEKSEVEFSNPFDLGTAIKFGALYAVVLLVSRAAQLYYGDAGVIFSSVITGLVDVDAITLSVSELSNAGVVDLITAKRAIVLAAMSNTVVKSGIVLISGSPALRKVILPGVVLMLVTGISVAFLL